MRALVLASASPRRAELLARVGLEAEVVVCDVDESHHAGESAADYVARVAAVKAASGARRRPGAVVVAADTAVVLDGTPLGKPAGDDGARRMLASLSGRTHEVLTAVVVHDGEGAVHAATEVARVEMAALDAAEIDWYVDTGEPADKAGAYGLQGAGAVLVRRIEGDATTVVGLPLRTTVELLRSAGVVVAGL